MSSASLPQPCHRATRVLRAAILGLAFAVSTPLFADTLADAQKQIRQAKFPQALATLDLYLETSPNDAQARFLKGVIYTETSKTDEAIIVFTKLTQDYPEFPEPYNNLAVIYAQQKQYNMALTVLEMAVQAHPSYATAYENLGDLYARLASDAYGKAAQLDGASKSAKTKLALSRELTTMSPKAGGKTTTDSAAARKATAQ